MAVPGSKAGARFLTSPLFLLILLIIIQSVACRENRGLKILPDPQSIPGSSEVNKTFYRNQPDFYIMVLPAKPAPGEGFRILVTGKKDLRKEEITIEGPSGNLKSVGSISNQELPFWRIDDFVAKAAGRYRILISEAGKPVSALEFAAEPYTTDAQGQVIWSNRRSWDSNMETLYSVWINALFHDCDEQSVWPSLNQVIQDRQKNFLFNYLSPGEDNADRKDALHLRPDCADNPFFLRAYFSWKMGLPFGFHLCNRGSLNRSPSTGQWITNGKQTPGTDPVRVFNNFLLTVMNGVHSGTARTSLDNENSDYYPVLLEKETLRPGIIYADPYGHTLTITGWVPQEKGRTGLLLAVDAQPDGTIGIKRFWKGNFLFNTTGVVGEPGFKAFRPIILNNRTPRLLKDSELTAEAGYVPYSLMQRKMSPENFYHTIERLINPRPLDPENELNALLQALYEQLQVRVLSVSNGEDYFRAHPGVIISMPSSSPAIFQSGGLWEDYSTPNRDLRLLIAIDEVTGFPERVSESPADFNLSGSSDPEHVRQKLQEILDKKSSALYISYTRSDGSVQKLTLSEIIERKEALEMAYNPNDGVEIRWGAPENSSERATCKRHAPSDQYQKMLKIRSWFRKRLHPPT